MGWERLVGRTGEAGGVVVGQMEEEMPASSLWKIRPRFMTPPYGMLASHNSLLRFPFAARPSTFSFLPPPEGEGEKEEGAPQNFFLAQVTGVFSWAEAKPFLSETLSTRLSTGWSIRPICVDICALKKLLFLTCYKTFVFFFPGEKPSCLKDSIWLYFI